MAQNGVRMLVYPATPAARDRFILDRRPPRPERDPWRYQNLIVEDERGAGGVAARSATVFLTGRECPWRCVMCEISCARTPASSDSFCVSAMRPVFTPMCPPMSAKAYVSAIGPKICPSGPFIVNNGNRAQTGHVSTANGTAFGYRTSNGQTGGGFAGQNGTVVRGANNTYAGNDGNVYRKDSNGSWSKYDNGNWNSVDTGAAKQQAQQKFNTNHPNAQQNAQTLQQNHPNAQQNVQNVRQSAGGNLGGETRSPSLYGNGTMQGLNRSSAARQRGQMQTGRFQNMHRMGGGGRFHR